MKQRILKRLIYGLVVVFFMVGSSWARVYWVSPGGSGDECTQTNPCALQHALDDAKSNGEDDTIYLLAGTYEGNFRYSPPDTEHKSLTIQGAPGTTPQEVILDGQNSGQVLRLYGYSSGDQTEVLIEGLTIRNGRSITQSGGLYAVLHGYNITVRHGIIHDNVGTGAGGGAYVETDHTVVFEDNVVYNNTVNERQNVSLYQSLGGGVSIWAPTAYIRNNLIYGNRAQGENCSPQGGGLWIHASTDSGSYLINNTIAQNQAAQGGGVYLEHGTHYLYNNIVSQNTAGEGADIYLWNNSGVAYHNDYVDFYGSWDEEGGNIDADSLFVAPDQGDFHLSQGSPCIDGGTNDIPDPPGLPDTDFEGDPRVMGGTVDIGADEYPEVTIEHQANATSFTGGDNYDTNHLELAFIKPSTLTQNVDLYISLTQPAAEGGTVTYYFASSSQKITLSNGIYFNNASPTTGRVSYNANAPMPNRLQLYGLPSMNPIFNDGWVVPHPFTMTDGVESCQYLPDGNYTFTVEAYEAGTTNLLARGEATITLNRGCP